MRLACCLALLPLILCAAGKESNNGEDFTRPLSRFDLRYQYQDRADGVEQSRFILRTDHPFVISERWRLATRLDLPLVLNNATGLDNPNGDTRFGVGDLLVQTAIIYTATDRFACGAGLRAQFPTATQSQLGTGKYQLGPLIGVRYKLPELSSGSFFQPVVRYNFDVGGDPARNNVSRLHLGPTLNVVLSQRWFLTLYPSQDIVLNNINGHRWFVPADFLIGRHLSERVLSSVEISIPLLKQFTLYDFKLETRLSFFF